MSKNTKKTILIVEDDHVISSTLAELLEDSGYGALTAYNGAEALLALRVHAKPGLILLDLMMPIMDGLQFREAQLADPAMYDIPVVVMSADVNMLEKRSKLSAKDYLRKPLDIYKLLDVIEKHVS